MARTLKLYKSITPNLNNGMHYHFTSFSAYLSELGRPYMTNTLGDYRLTQGTIDVYTEDIKEDSMLITYAVEEDGDYHRCYHVNGVELYASAIHLDIAIDLWGSYFDKATISNMIVSRSTRDIGGGIYPDVNFTAGEGVATEIGTHAWQMYVLFTIEKEIDQNIFDKSSVLELYATPIDNTWSRDYFISDFLPKFSSIKELGAVKCGVINAWITYENTFLKFSPAFTFTCASGTIEGYKVIPSLLTKTFGGSTAPNKAVYIGTRLNNIRVKNYIDTTGQYAFDFITSNSDLRVLVRQGENSKDITDSFTLDITSQGAENVNGKNTITAIRSLLGIGTSIAGFATGNVAVGVSGLLGAATPLINPQERSKIGSGNAINTFWDELGNRQAPYMQVEYEGKAIDDYSIYGCYFNKAATFATFFNASLIYGCTESFIQAASNVDGIPISAANAIRTQLANGIKIKRLV